MGINQLYFSYMTGQLKIKSLRRPWCNDYINVVFNYCYYFYYISPLPFQHSVLFAFWQLFSFLIITTNQNVFKQWLQQDNMHGCISLLSFYFPWLYCDGEVKSHPLWQWWIFKLTTNEIHCVISHTSSFPSVPKALWWMGPLLWRGCTVFFDSACSQITFFL